MLAFSAWAANCLALGVEEERGRGKFDDVALPRNSLEILRFKLKLQCGVASTGQRHLYPAISGHPPVSALEELGLGKCPSCLAGWLRRDSMLSRDYVFFFSSDEVGPELGVGGIVPARPSRQPLQDPWIRVPPEFTDTTAWKQCYRPLEHSHPFNLPSPPSHSTWRMPVDASASPSRCSDLHLNQ